MTDQEVQRIVCFIRNKCGIDLVNKKILIEGRLDSYLQRNGYQDADSFMDAVETDITGRSAETLVNIITTNHTYFMREFEHFDFLKQVALPQICEKEKKTKDLRIWCAACATGEEPYTIAMVLSDYFALDKKNWDTKILATDISTDVIKFAMKGIYTAEQLKNIPPTWLQRYFRTTSSDKYAVSDELKSEVLFRQFNLINTFPFRKPMHIIFLRNVMIYFDKQTKVQLLNNIYNYLEPGGYLFLGTTESIDRGSTKFNYVQPSVYCK